jgi:Metal-dependent proteases with possible chaperone activity
LLAGKGLALATGKPLIAVNHLEGHALSPRLADPDLEFPYLLLLVSGGHCQLLEVRGVGSYRRLATTIDDAAGEAFDKAAKLLGLAYPGGPAIEELAMSGDAKAVPFRVRWSVPASRISRSRALRARCSEPSHRAGTSRRTSPRPFSRRSSIVSSIARRSRFAIATPLRSSSPGGVAANTAIRGALAVLADREGRRFSVPPTWLCTDNAAMIAWAGSERFSVGLTDDLDAPARARWPLDESAERVRGAGVKA